MDIKYPHTYSEYRIIMDKVNELFEAVPGTTDHNLYEILVELLDAYERDRWSMQYAHPIEALQLHMTLSAYGVKDLAKVLKSLKVAEDILAQKTRLTVSMIWDIHQQWQIPVDSLIRTYAVREEPFIV